MLGVVLWSDQVDRKAVFWCEDHGDLAYFDGSVSELDGTMFFDAGDMVRFDVSVEQRLRKAVNPRMVQERACAGLTEKLKRTVRPTLPGAPRQSAKIIAFSTKDRDAEAPLSAMKA